LQLALGTVQFGMPYGITGSKLIPAGDDVRKILGLAFERGINTLDTAPAYGNIESRLDSLCGRLGFRIISKIPPLPSDMSDLEACQWAVDSANASRQRLGEKLHALLFHRAEDLLESRGAAVLDAVATWADSANVLIGASGYEPAEVRALLAAQSISIAQLPGNALDQRISGVADNLDPKPELHLRSAFLQGLLLAPYPDAIRLVPAAAGALRKWHDWIERRQISALHGAFSVIKGFKDVDACVVGVENLAQLTELLDAWQESKAVSAVELASSDPRTIDPRMWG
jgi:aryl-alcohol dehydrogenase-like predicted oxidoreductase